jgi:osmoprotectant transport system substrate-binding protein
MRLVRTIALAATTVALLASAACGGDSLEDDSGDGGGGGGNVVLSGQNFTEMQIMAAMYAQVLEKAGYDVTTKLVSTRDVYIDQMKSGKVDVVPEYLSGLADYLNIDANGENAKPISSNDPGSTLEGLKPLAEQYNITLLTPSQATDQNAFFVTKDFAEQNSLTALSDVAALGEPVTLAAAEDCVGRSDCEKGLTDVYGIDIKEVLPTGFGSAPTKEAVKDGEAQLGLTGTTDGTLDAMGLMLLEDDKGIQPAQNLIPAVSSQFLDDHPDVAEPLNELSATLTTEDLAQMNVQVDVERQKPEDVAQSYLQEQDLL